jgi:hypothetical protein
MLSLQIQNPMVENYLHEHFKDDTKQMSLFINDFIEKELIKKDIKIAFDELNEIMTKREKRKSLQDFILEITPNNG